MPIINIFKTDYDQKTVFEGSPRKLSREINEGFEKCAKKYNWPRGDFKAQLNAGFKEAIAQRNRSKEAKRLDFLAKIDEQFPVEFE